jgi:hypothetical protein
LALPARLGAQHAWPAVGPQGPCWTATPSWQPPTRSRRSCAECSRLPTRPRWPRA